MHRILDGVDMVAFDIMGVIITEPSMVRNGLYPIYKDKFSYEYIKELYNKAKINVDGDTALWKSLGVDNPDIAREEYLKSFKKDRCFERIRRYLNKRNIQKGIISNMPEEWGDYFVEKFKLRRDFDPILLSADIGVAKPDYGKYDEFISRAKVRGDRILFIDDKLKNLEIGKRFGFKTVLFDRGKEQEGYEPDLVIDSFKDLI
jgi:FMN phosphatase YigB (HAD superfamily)